MNKTILLQKQIVYFIILMIIMISIVGCSSSSTNSDEKNSNETNTETKKDKKTKKAKKINIDTLIKNYEENELSANKKYKDKYVKVTGYFYSADEVLGSSSISISSSDDFSFTNVVCSLDKKQIDKATDFKKGDKVTLVGTIKGLSIFDIKFKDDCKIK